VRVRADRGGVRFLSNLHEALRVALWSRIAMRLLWPLAEAEARGAEGLYDAAHAVPWEEHLDRGATFAVEATLRDSEHTHSGFVALKIKDALVDRLRERRGGRPDVDTRRPDVRVVAHLAGTRLSLSLDVAGAPLNKRGYRVRPTVAPLKETLAAAILRAVRYTGDEPLVDPMCGSGTFLIEAGLLAVRRAPSLHRPFGIERWPTLGAEARTILDRLRAEARAHERRAPFPIRGLDRSGEALEAVRSNVRAARLEREISVAEADATRPLPLGDLDHGLLVTNPPYGDRLTQGGQKGMKTFYFHLGERLGALAGFRLAILSGNPAFEAAFHHRPLRRRPLWNGPIECTLLEYAARGSGSAPRSDPRLAAPEQSADVPPVGPEHRQQEHRGQPGRGRRSPRHQPGHGDGDEPGEQ
ncbi:MAG TPA: THUMP domain-containing protein, partial [Myxococcaceae bacterium]|nr:THUMP domain-containing protein [Myxococcaceae bacterium]